MNNLSADVKSEYLYSLNMYTPAVSRCGEILSERDVFDAHFVLADVFISTGEMARFGILNFNLLSSAVSRQTVGYGNYSKWPDEYTKVATLAFGLDKNHAFNDGNKRTALLCLLMALHRSNRVLTCKKSKLETLLVRIAANTMNDYSDFKRYTKKYGEDAIVYYIASFIRHNSRKIEQQFRTMTYEEFNRKLNVYGLWLDNPSGNYINVYGERITTKFLGFIRKKEQTKILQIGFPGWKRQINPKAVKNVLKETGITLQNGFDMKTFYEGNEPEYKLIDEYFDILKRLKDK